VHPRLARSLPFENFAIDHLVDRNGRYHMELDPSFPFAIKLFSYDGCTGPYPLNWHERLELFIPISGEGEFVNGDHCLGFSAGDILIIDTMRPHGLADFRGRKRRSIVITFSPEFIYSVGSPMCDSLFLVPFQTPTQITPCVIRRSDRLAPPIWNALARLVDCYFSRDDGIRYQAGCKALLLQVLYYLGIHAGSSVTRSEYLRRQEQSQLMGKLHDYLSTHFDQKVSITKAATLLGMSESKFMRYFRTMTGETFVSYLTRLRLERAAVLLEESQLSIGDIAASVGFSDQSYFDRVFRRSFGKSPRELRRKHRDPGKPTGEHSDGLSGRAGHLRV
jgi:AraC-like DNA-binding protein